MRCSTSCSLLLVAVTSCGGISTKYTIDEVKLARIPMADKQPLFTAQNQISVARANKLKADSALETVAQEVSLAEADVKQAKLERDKAKISVELAEKSGDAGQKQAADAASRVAELGERAAEAHLAAFEQKENYHSELAKLAEQQIGLAMAAHELEKAKLASSKNVDLGKDFRLDKFTVQHADWQRKVDEKRRSVDEARAKLDRLIQTDKDLTAQHEQARAPKVTAPSPVPDPSTAPSTTATAPTP